MCLLCPQWASKRTVKFKITAMRPMTARDNLTIAVANALFYLPPTTSAIGTVALTHKVYFQNRIYRRYYTLHLPGRPSGRSVNQIDRCYNRSPNGPEALVPINKLLGNTWFAHKHGHTNAHSPCDLQTPDLSYILQPNAACC